ncbi:hypothetical protein J6590_087240 [Homalodisca vitripennis]|nr:hypothetical protein J6590_087240 [Homalodisca vitripennis]
MLRFLSTKFCYYKTLAEQSDGSKRFTRDKIQQSPDPAGRRSEGNTAAGVGVHTMQYTHTMVTIQSYCSGLIVIDFAAASTSLIPCWRSTTDATRSSPCYDRPFKKIIPRSGITVKA